MGDQPCRAHYARSSKNKLTCSSRAHVKTSRPISAPQIRKLTGSWLSGEQSRQTGRRASSNVKQHLSTDLSKVVPCNRSCPPSPVRRSAARQRRVRHPITPHVERSQQREVAELIKNSIVCRDISTVILAHC